MKHTIHHDLDPNIDKVLRDTGIKFDKITKDQMDAANGKIDSGEPLDLKHYLATESAMSDEAHIRRLAVLTSPSGAAVRDFLDTRDAGAAPPGPP